MTITIFYNIKPNDKNNLFKDVQFISLEHQKDNTKDGSYYLSIHFKKGKPKYIKYKKGEISLKIEPY